MRANGVDSIRGIQAALMEGVAPEIQSEFALNVMQTVQMLLESLAGEWDTAAEDLNKDNRTLVVLLSQSSQAIAALPQSNNQLAPFVPEIEGVQGGPAVDSLAISALSARNGELRAMLERVLGAFENMIDSPAYAGLRPVRQAIYQHLRDVAAR